MSLTVLDKITAEESVLFTTFAEFKNSENLHGRQSSKFLSLGESFPEWYGMTVELRDYLYELAINRGIELSPNLPGSSDPGKRTALVLFGNLALYLSMELSRILNQVKSINIDRYVLKDFSDARYFHFKAPITTSESLVLLNSKEFLDLLEVIASRHHFGVNAEIVVKLHRATKPTASKLGFLPSAYLIAQRILAPLSRRSKYFLLSTYAGRLNEIFLNLSLNQAPLLAEVRPREDTHEYPEESIFHFTGGSSLEHMIAWLMGILVPQKLTSGIERTLKTANQMGFPENPEVVLTANSFETDDEFKAHFAYRCQNATYLVAQHGVGYGVSLFRERAPELEIADRFLSWGSARHSNTSSDFGLIKKVPRVSERRPKRGVELFLRPDKFNFYSFADETLLTKTYLDSIVALCHLLDKSGIEVSLRPHSAMKAESLEYLRERINRLHRVRIASKPKNMASLMRSGLGLVFTYDSTGMLELGVSNHTFFAFLPDGLGHVIPDYVANYDWLQQVGLLSFDPMEAASLIEKWVKASNPVENYEKAVRNFIAGIARENRAKLSDLRIIVKNASRR